MGFLVGVFKFLKPEKEIGWKGIRGS